MNNNQQLKLQSYLDGELSSREAKAIADWLAQESDARALLAELQMTKTALAGNELELKLPETREFYWSKIQRQIERETPVKNPPMTNAFLAGLRKYFVPLAGGAAALLAFMLASNQPVSPMMAYVPGEVETSGDMTAYTFRSQSEKMTVVWLADRNNSEFTESDSENNLDIQ